MRVAQPGLQETSFSTCICTGTSGNLVKNAAAGPPPTEIPAQSEQVAPKLYFEKLPKWFLISQEGPSLYINIWESMN